jgi:Arc/MetJ family transcription regulator
MSRTLIDIDDDALRRAAQILGTSTKVETVNRALQLVVESAGRGTARDRFDDLLDLVGDRLSEIDVSSEAWHRPQ